MQRPWLQFYRPGVPAEIEQREIPLFQLLEERAASHPDLTAIAFYDRMISYRELVPLVNRMANALRAAGVQKGDRVAIMLPNCPQYIISYYGALKAGAVIAQVNPLFVERELQYLLSDSGARVIVCLDLLYPKVKAVLPHTNLERVILVSLQAPPEQVGPEAMRFDQALAAAPATDPGVPVGARDLAVLLYTGGTTGLPKGAMLTHFNLVSNVLQVWPTEEDPGSVRILTILPLFHSYGMTCCMNLGLAIGARLILLPRFEIDQVMQAIKQHQPTHFPGVPTMYVAVLHYPNAESFGIASIKQMSSGGAAMPEEVRNVFEQKFGATLGEGFGLSEASPVTHANPSGFPGAVHKRGSIGVPVRSTDARIVDADTGARELPPGEVGELLIRGPQVMAGYWNLPNETAQALRDGWLYTGDLARMDTDGYFWIVDRKKDMIIVSGYNVYPLEVDNVLYQHPAVLEACTVGSPDPVKGEVVKAFVAPKPGQRIDPDQLIAFCRERLAPYKVPKLVEVRDALPKSTVGKLLRRVLTQEERERAGG